MGIFAVASVAIGGGMGDRWDLTDLVPERCMARRTFDLMIRHMFLVKGLRRIFRREYFRFVMAFNTLSLGHMGISLNHTEMTLFASDPSFNILPMIETPTINCNISLRLNVAGGATPDRTGNTLLFPSQTRPVVVADETVGLMNGEVQSLHNLGMAGGTSKFHPPSQFLEVFSMGKGHILIDHISL